MVFCLCILKNFLFFKVDALFYKITLFRGEKVFCSSPPSIEEKLSENLCYFIEARHIDQFEAK